jgi:hypothetical protein
MFTGLKRTACSTFLLAFSIYIFLPTPDQLLIFPAVGLLLSYTFHISFVFAVLLTALCYYAVGAASLIGALLIGGKPIYQKLKERYRKRKAIPLLDRTGHF